jgi:hypothetical protein
VPASAVLLETRHPPDGWGGDVMALDALALG